MDTLFIRALRADTIIGVSEWERINRQVILLDLQLSVDVKRATVHDAIADTTDYNAVTKRIISFVQQSQFQLVETLAENIGELVLHEFNVRWLRLTVTKVGAIPDAAEVGITIERSR